MEYQLTLNWPDFLERHWQKRPVVLKRGFNNFIDPLSPDELAGLAMESEVDSRLVSHQDGKWRKLRPSWREQLVFAGAGGQPLARANCRADAPVP